MKKEIIAASILSANFAHLGEEAKKVLAAGADRLHFDVMDNHYVPNLTVGPMVCHALRKDGITAPIDVHLMTKPTDSLIPTFADAGATSITIHPEATEHLDRSLTLIKEHGCQVGLALNPTTPLNYLKYILDKLDMILIMTVNPGFGGQSFIPAMEQKILDVYTIIHLSHQNVGLAVDGGVHPDTITTIAQAGADTFVAGSAIFGSADYSETITLLRQKIQQAKT